MARSLEQAFKKYREDRPRLPRRLARAYLWLEDHGWALANALVTVAILTGIALALAGGGR